ncbi:hypothetical protein H9W95_12705 [Flavobacterium lindanitolerans]|nr:hypothetical protein [Flavobacterium lindanitolerans]
MRQYPAAATLTATDACGSATVTFAETRTDGACAGSYTLTRKWTATDLCGNTAVHTRVVTVTDTQAPVFAGTLPAAEVAASCDSIPGCGCAYCDRCLRKCDRNIRRDQNRWCLCRKLYPY